MRLRFTIRDLFWLTLVVVGGCSPASRDHADVDPLPALDEISEMAVQESEDVKFGIPQAHWQSVFDALRPAALDNHPSKWVVLGDLSIIRKDGRPFNVYLFDISDGPGAFAAGETWETRRYYRGGDSAKLKKALEAAQSSTF